MGYAEQARLSEQHRAAQARLQAIVAADTAKVFPLLDVNNLDKSFGQYFDGMKNVVNARRTISASLGASYFNGIRNDSGISSVFSPLLAGAVNEDQLFTSLLVTGPISMKKNMANGVSAEAARKAALTSTIKANQRHVINGGRETILNSVRRDKGALGWARLTDGKPCAFCALLASRGPAYKTETTGGFKSHDGCGCTPVPVFDFAAPWPGDAEKYRAAYDENISGKFPGGDGNNKAVQAWRKHYDDAFLGGREVVQAADAVAEVVESSLDWSTAWQAAKAKLPEDLSTIGRIGARELTPKEAKELALVVSQRQGIEDLVRRYNRTEIDQATLRRDYKDLIGEDLPEYGLSYGLRTKLTMLEREQTKFTDLRRGRVDTGKDIFAQAPGPVINEHLDAVLQAGNAVGQELERRIALRLGDTSGSAKALADVVAKREAVEKKLEDALAKAKAYKETIRPKAATYVDAGRGIAGATREESIEKTLQNLIYFDKTNRDNIKKIKSLTDEQGRFLAQERALADGIKPGTPQYAIIQREETIKLLGEVREMGGAGATYVKKGGVPIKKGELIAAMEKAHEAYPATWMQRVRAMYPEVDLASSTRGYNAGGTEIRLSKATTKGLPDDVGYDAVAIHELGHSMETAVEGLAEMEWAYHFRRGAIVAEDGTLTRATPEWMGGRYGRDEVTVRDNWREAYTGKVYSNSPTANMEVFTTGVESLFAGSRYLSNEALGYDTEFRDWLLGVLSVL